MIRPEHFDQIPASIDEAVKRAVARVGSQLLTHHRGEPIEATAHIAGLSVQMHSDLTFGEEHQPRTTCSTTPPPRSSRISQREVPLGRLRVALALLAPLARALGVSTEEFIGEQAPPGKRGPVPKLQQQMERIQRLPKSQQRFVMQMIDTVLAQQDR